MSGNPRSSRWRAAPGRPSITPTSARRSRFVGLMKLVLPLAAALLIAILVGWPGHGIRDDGFRLSFLSERGQQTPEPGMVHARYMGTDSNNHPFIITADRATQVEDDPDTIVLHTLQADLTLEDGAWLALTARSGVFSRGVEKLRLNGPVSLFSDDGYEFRAEFAEVDLARGTVESDRPVSGQGPLGLLDAGSFRLVDQGRRLYFSAGVKLVLFPGARG